MDKRIAQIVIDKLMQRYLSEAIFETSILLQIKKTEKN